MTSEASEARTAEAIRHGLINGLLRAGIRAALNDDGSPTELSTSLQAWHDELASSLATPSPEDVAELVERGKAIADAIEDRFGGIEFETDGERFTVASHLKSVAAAFLSLRRKVEETATSPAEAAPVGVVLDIPKFIRGWTAPFHVTMDGIKDAKGCWICSTTNNKLAHELVELMNYAAALTPAKADTDAIEAGWVPTHRHVKRGSEYEIVGEAEVQISKGTVEDLSFNPLPARVLREGDMLTIYRAKNGKLWARFPAEFRDGRFVLLSAAPSQGGDQP